MQTYHVGLIALATFSLLGLFAYLSWKARMRKQQFLIESPQLLEGADSGQNGFYVATTFAGRPLDRVLAHGLAHRGRAKVLISPNGVSIFRTGETSFLIPASNVLGVNQTSAVIDRAVEKDGLVSIHWMLGPTEVETHLRFVADSERQAILSQLSELAA